MGSVTRRLQTLNSRVFSRINRAEISEALRRLGVREGETLYARVSMRSLGYVTGGAEEAVGAVLDVLGEQGTLLMSAWPEADPARIRPGELFDVAETPSRAGLMSEALRRHPGAVRSLHPIASVVAMGPRAAELLAGHEASPTPFGPETPYGRLDAAGARFLLVGTHLGGILYAVQERVGFPNLLAPAASKFEARDAQGRYRTITTATLRSDVPPVIILPGSRPENRDYILVPDYALMFPSDRERRIMDAGYLRFNRSRFLGRRERLQVRGILTTGKVGAAEAALLDGPRLLDQIARDMAWDIARFKDEYDPEQLVLLSLPVV